MDCRKCDNNRCFINKHCSKDWLEYVQAVKTISHISKEKRIFSEGDLVQGIYVVCSGKFMLKMRIDKDNENIVRLAGAGQILGHRGFYDEMTYPVSAETIVQSEIAFISYEDFIKLVRKNSDLSLFLIMFYASELVQSDRKLKLQINQSSRAKVMFSLQRVYEAFGSVIEGKITLESMLDLEKLANFASVLPEDFIEILDDLKTESKLELDGEQIHILDEDYFLTQNLN